MSGAPARGGGRQSLPHGAPEGIYERLGQKGPGPGEKRLVELLEQIRAICVTDLTEKRLSSIADSVQKYENRGYLSIDGEYVQGSPSTSSMPIPRASWTRCWSYTTPLNKQLRG
jgi:hypothetical protein